MVEIITDTSLNQMVVFKNSMEELNMKVGISYTSNANATLNLTTEVPHWDFEQIGRGF